MVLKKFLHAKVFDKITSIIWIVIVGEKDKNRGRIHFNKIDNKIYGDFLKL